MTLSFGHLIFEEGDILHVEDEFGKETLIAVKDHNCPECIFREICDERKTNNIFAKYCVSTHFKRTQYIKKEKLLERSR